MSRIETMSVDGSTVRVERVVHAGHRLVELTVEHPDLSGVSMRVYFLEGDAKDLVRVLLDALLPED